MDQRIGRRSFVAGTLGTAAWLTADRAVGLGGAGARRGRRLPPIVGEGTFRHGVAAGQPGQRSATLWTRLDGIDYSAPLGLEVAADPDFRRVLHRGRVRVAQIRDYTVHARFSSRALRPGEEYWYRFFTRSELSPVGRFRTRRPSDSAEPVRIGFFSCQDWTAGYYNAHVGLAAEDLDFVVSLGDYIYEKRFVQGPPGREDTLGANGDGNVQTLPEYRSKYRMYRSDPSLQAMHAAHAVVATWDDHEVEDNYSPEEGGSETDERRVPFAERRRAGRLAFFENMPQPWPRDDRNRIYRALRLGAHAELFLLDQRSYRDDQPCGDRLIVPPCGDTETPGRDYLGGEQKEWFKRGLERSRATWKLVGNPLMIMAVDAPRGNPAFLDGWDGYGAERREVMAHIEGKQIANVAFLTGDYHEFFAGDVMKDGRTPGRSLATEFVGGSITAFAVPEYFAGGAGSVSPAPGGERGFEPLINALVDENPHVKYHESVHHGYGVVEAGPEELQVEFRAVETTRSPTAPMLTLKRMRVRSGVPEVELL